MRTIIDISADEATLHEGAVVSLSTESRPRSELYIDFSSVLRAVPQPSERAIDLLLVAATVYSLDQLIPRSMSDDHWKRDFEVTIPVQDSRKWSRMRTTINECLSFLSGDVWKMTFTERTCPIIRPKERIRQPRSVPHHAQGSTACLFSGGLDSLVGAIDWLDLVKDEKLCLVGHHDPNIGGVKKDQDQLVKVLGEAYADRFQPILIGVGHTGESAELTMRSRSLLFVALGIIVAAHLGRETPLLIPENGTIALNVPLTPSRRASCSTRTAHPHFLKLLQHWLDGIGLHHSLQNPLMAKTKGEVVSECRDQNVLKNTALLSTSCAKNKHRRWWIRRTANACGQCMPCIYRRAALHTIGLDSEVYGNDICTGEVNVDDPDSDSADDFRACLSFVRRNHNQTEIAKMLISNAPLPPLDVLAYANTVGRAMDEIRQLLRDKATPDIQRMAGI
jgi:hypothetical protein